jgi:hypothetical protein
MGVAVIRDQHRLSDYYILFEMNTVFCCYQTPGIYQCIFIDHYNGFPILLRRSNNIDNGILPDLNRITKLDSVRFGPQQITSGFGGHSAIPQ